MARLSKSKSKAKTKVGKSKAKQAKAVSKKRTVSKRKVTAKKSATVKKVSKTSKKAGSRKSVSKEKAALKKKSAVKTSKTKVPLKAKSALASASVGGPVAEKTDSLSKPPVTKTATAKVRSFRVGEKVFCPPHGVGEVSALRDELVGDMPLSLYEITIIDSMLKVKVPLSLVESQGLRPVSDRKAIDKVFNVLRDKKGVQSDNQTWNRRQREYTQKIKTGSLVEMAKVFRDLSVLSTGKELSFGEKKMLDQVQDLLVGEISVAKARSQDKVRVELSQFFA